MASLSTCHLELVVWDGNLVKSCYVYNCILYFIQYYVLHCIDPVLKINVSKLFVLDVFLFVVDVIHTFYLQSINFLSSKY